MGGYIGAGVLKEYQDEYALPLAPAGGGSTMVRSKTVGDVTSLSLADTKSWCIAAAADKGTPRLGGTPHFGPLGGVGRLPDGLSGGPGASAAGSGFGGSSNSLSALSPLAGGGSSSRLSEVRSSSRFAITAPAVGAGAVAAAPAISASGADSNDDVGISLDSGGVTAVSSATSSGGAVTAAAFPVGASPRVPGGGVGGSALLHSLLRSGVPVTTATLTLPSSSVPGAAPAAASTSAVTAAPAGHVGRVASPAISAGAASASASPSASSLSAPGVAAAAGRRGTPSPSVAHGSSFSSSSSSRTPPPGAAAYGGPAAGLRSSGSGGSALHAAVYGAGHAHHAGAGAAAGSSTGTAAAAGPSDGSTSASAAPSPSHLDISLAVGKPVSVPIVIKPAAIAAAAVGAAAVTAVSHGHGHGHGHGHVHGHGPVLGHSHGHPAAEGPSPSSAFGAAVAGAASLGAPLPGSGTGVITMTNRQASLRREGKLVLSMVGLPARGKTAIARRLKRHLTWAGYRCEIFNVGNYRRRFLGASQPAAFFDPANQEAVLARHEMARLALEDMTSSLADDSVDIAIFDATNSTIERRRWLAKALREREGALGMRFQLVFIESSESTPACIVQTRAYARNVCMHGHAPLHRGFRLLALLDYIVSAADFPVYSTCSFCLCPLALFLTCSLLGCQYHSLQRGGDEAQDARLPRGESVIVQLVRARLGRCAVSARLYTNCCMHVLSR